MMAFLSTAVGPMVAVWDPSPNIPVQLVPRWSVALPGVARCVRWNHTNQVVGVSGDGGLLVRALACSPRRSSPRPTLHVRHAARGWVLTLGGLRVQSLHHHASGTCVGRIPDPTAPDTPTTTPLAVEPSTLSSIAFSKGSRYLATVGPPCKEVLIWDLKRKVRRRTTAARHPPRPLGITSRRSRSAGPRQCHAASSRNYKGNSAAALPCLSS